MELNHISKALIFLIVFLILGLLFFVVRDMVQVEPDPVFNFQPVPNMAPRFLPTPDINLPCSSKLKTCTYNEDCQASCGSDFSCVEVSEGQNVVYNNTTVGVGKWCLPKLPDPNEKTCNIYTGRWTWSADPSCNTKNGQCWKCICMYPTLFANPDTGCTTQVGCTYKDKDSVQKGSLVSSIFNKDFDTGEATWDPTISNPLVLSKDPMDVDEQSRPKWVCSCPLGTTRIPNDPYTCYPDKCCGSKENCALSKISTEGTQAFKCISKDKSKISDEECAVGFTDPNLCECVCNCNFYSNTTSIKGLCYPTDILCKNGSYNKDTGQCNCTAPYYNTPCTNAKNPEGPTQCSDQNNPLGFQCWNVCGGDPCGDSTIATCGLNPSTNTRTCTCKTQLTDCENNTYTLVPKSTENPTCNETCIPAGFVDSETITSPGTLPVSQCDKSQRDKCCNGSETRIGGDLGQIQYVYCK